MTTSLLPDVDIVDAIKSHNDNQAKNATERYTTQVGRAHSGLVRLARKAARLYDNPVDATNAAADLLERFSDSVEGNGDAIVSSLAQQTAGTNQVQTRELEAAQQRVIEAEQKLSEANNLKEQLREEARKSSNLQASLDAAEREKTRLQRELDQAKAKVTELEQSAGKPNPLSERVRTLEAENSDLKAKLTQANSDKKAAAQPENPSGKHVAGDGDTSSRGEPEPQSDPAEPKGSRLIRRPERRPRRNRGDN